MPSSFLVRLLPVTVFLASALAIAPVVPSELTRGRIGSMIAPVLAVMPAGPADDAVADDANEDDADEVLTLDRIFPKKSIWGPSARSIDFNHDGRFAAFLYHPYAERRHGNDLYIYDTTTGQTRRMTSLGRLAEFQADTRKVRDDREKNAKKAGVTLADLAREQAERLGWARDTPAGQWEGDATSSDTEPAIRPGPSRLSLEHASGGALSGEIRVGLVRLPITKAEYDRDARTLTADIDDEALKVKGTLEASFAEDAGSLSGTITLEDPTQTLAFDLTPAEPEADDEDAAPKGVLGAIGERLTLGDVVSDTDAEINDEKDGKRPDKTAPRYGGVQGYEWSDIANEMLLITGGDVYRLTIDTEAWDAPFERPAVVATDSDEDGDHNAEEPGADELENRDVDDADDDAEDAEEHADDDSDKPKKAAKPDLEPVTPYLGGLERLTRTRERESDVQYLPDGSGYTYLRAGALLRVSFGDHHIVQLDPELKDGESMVGYRISPDQSRLVFLANRGDSFWGSGRQVTIVNYRERFARARQVTRHMPDDPWPEAFSSVYLYDLTGHGTEEGTLERVFTKRITGPRDSLRVPEWSPDSSRVAFAVFEQTTGLIKILEAGFTDESEDEPHAGGELEGDASDEEQSDSEQDQDSGDKTEDDASTEDEAEENTKPEFKIENAEVVYEFFHFGGPNTPNMVHPQYLPDSRRVAFISEISGFRQLHVLDPRYQQLSQLTEGQFEVYPFGISDDHSTLFVTATKDDPTQEHAFTVDLESGDMARLTPGEGVYSSVAISDDGAHVLASFIDFGSPRELRAITTGDDSTMTVLTESHPAEAHKLSAVAPEYFTYENRHGQTIHGHMFKPSDWTPEDRRPLLIYVYGGPLGERKMATRGAFSAPSYFFARYMTEVHGYITATIDPRGASGYGAVFEKANFEQVGKPQTEDLVDGANWLVEHAGVDKSRMGLHGWSFGGFQTQMVMYTEPDVFAVGMAGAGPTEWFNYNSWYTTGTIGPHKPGDLNLEDHSLLPLAKNLTGRLLLIHGMEDSNVLYQDTVNVYRELLKADKEVNVELFLDPTGGHGLGGDIKTIGRYRKYEDFLLRFLGEGEAAPAEPEEEAVEAEVEPEEDDAGE
jgi:dipeptidyl-peptidase-4